MQKQTSKSLYNYWNSLRGSRSAPDRRNIDPTKIRTSLSNVFILESDETDDFSFRLVGSHIYSVYCRELKSRSFNQLWHEKDNDAIKTLIRAVTEDHAVAVATFQGTTQIGTQASFEVILLPLNHNGNTSSRILGAMSVIDEPYWLGTQPIMKQRITGLRLIWPDDPQIQDLARDISANIESDVVWKENDISPDQKEKRPISIPATIHGNSARRYAHLTVIDGGKNR